VRQQAQDFGMRFGISDRRDRGMVQANIGVASGPLDVEMFELSGGGQHDIRVPGGVGHEMLAHHGE
jgi:hypothetical protein